MFILKGLPKYLDSWKTCSLRKKKPGKLRTWNKNHYKTLSYKLFLFVIYQCDDNVWIIYSNLMPFFLP